MTAKQELAFRFIVRQFVLQQRPPSMRELTAYMGSRNPSVGFSHVEFLVKKGYLAYRDGAGSHRSVYVVGLSDAIAKVVADWLESQFPKEANL